MRGVSVDRRYLKPRDETSSPREGAEGGSSPDAVACGAHQTSRLSGRSGGQEANRERVCLRSQGKKLLLLLNHFSRVRPSVTPWTAAYQVPPSMGFSRQEYWSGLPLPPLQEKKVLQEKEGNGSLSLLTASDGATKLRAEG